MSASAPQVLAAVLDGGSFRPWGGEPPSRPADEAYAGQLARARARTGASESVLVGEGRVDGHRVAVVVSEFAFLGGSIGVHTGRLIADGVRRATAQGLPLLAAPTSGGTRMQEGTAAFLGMRGIAAALAAHRRAHLPYLVWLRDPTFGGVLASWGSLGTVIAAEPGAAIGFLGPKVFSALRAEQFPDDVQRAENLHAHGLVDACVPLGDLRRVTIRVLDVLRGSAAVPPRLADDPAGDQLADPVGGAWESVLRSRREDRPGVRQLFTHAGVDLVELSGTGHGESSAAIVLALARLAHGPCVVVGQDRCAQAGKHPIGPGALRVARRGFRLAADLQVPLVTVVDTPGAELSRAAEQGGLSAEIASCLSDLASLPVPSVCLLLGQGAGGAAIALAGTQRLVAARHAWLAALPPEAASALQYGATGSEPRVAQSHGIDSTALFRAGLAQRVVDERPDAADEPGPFSRRAIAGIEAELHGLAPR